MLYVEIKLSIVVCMYMFTRLLFDLFVHMQHILCNLTKKITHLVQLYGSLFASSTSYQRGEGSDMINSYVKPYTLCFRKVLDYNLFLVFDIVSVECNPECRSTFYLYLHNLPEAASALPRFI